MTGAKIWQEFGLSFIGFQQTELGLGYVHYSKSFEYTLLCMQVINPVYMTINGYVFPKLLPDWFSTDI